MHSVDILGVIFILFHFPLFMSNKRGAVQNEVSATYLGLKRAPNLGDTLGQSLGMTMAFDSYAKRPCFAYELTKITDSCAKTPLFAYEHIKRAARG